ncbi:MAG: GNAT family N-acetyltransferase [Pseudomonadota bacterium]
MRLRDATPDDIATLEHWDRQPHVIESGGADDQFDWRYEIPRKLDWREQLIAEIDGRAIGIVQIIDPELEESHYWGDVGSGFRAIDIWIGEARDLGRSYGTSMMRLALERCFASDDVNAVLIDPLESNTRAIRFYERLGFTPVERRRFGEDDCLVMQLERDAWASRQRRRTTGG